MHKWYSPGRWLLFAALTAQLTGCTSAGRSISFWPGRDRGDDQLAQLDGKADRDSRTKPAEARVPETTAKARKPGDKAGAIAKDDTRVADAATAKSKASTGDKDKSTSVAKGTAEVAARDVPKAQIKRDGEGQPERAGTQGTLPRDPFLPDGLAATQARKAPDQPANEVKNAALPFPDMNPGVAQMSRTAERPQSAAQTPVTESAPQSEIAMAGLSAGLPDWALDQAETPKPQESVISQIVANKLQPGQLKPGLATPPPRSSGPLTPPDKQLSSLCPEAQGEVRVLVRELDSHDSETLKRAIHRLGRMQTHAAAAAPALQALLQHNDSFVRVHAALALVRIQQHSPQVTQTLILGLRSPDPGVRSFAAAVLAEMGPHSADAVPALSAALQDRDGYVRLHVAEVLIRHADWSYPALQTLLQSLKDSDENIRWLATYSLAELAPQSPEAVTSLAAALRDPTPKVQIGAAYALGELGPIAGPAAAELRRCQLSDNPELRSASEFALQQIQF